MDRKSFTIFAISFVVLLAWGPFVNKFLYPSDERVRVVGTNDVSGVEVPLGEGSIVDVSESVTQSATQTVDPSPTLGVPVATPVVPGFEVKTVTLENDLASYQFSNAGGGLISSTSNSIPRTRVVTLVKSRLNLRSRLPN